MGTVLSGPDSDVGDFGLRCRFLLAESHRRCAPGAARFSAMKKGKLSRLDTLWKVSVSSPFKASLSCDASLVSLIMLLISPSMRLKDSRKGKE